MRLICILLMLPLVVHANNLPSFFNHEVEQEYNATLDHLIELLPPNGAPVLMVVLASPYGLLDIQPSRFSLPEDKSKFANFNMGAISGTIFSADKEFAIALPGLVLCHKEECRKRRVGQLREFISNLQSLAAFFENNADIHLLRRIDDNVYRVNNIFFTPVEALEYMPSTVAGFIPSANVTQHSNMANIPACIDCPSRTIKVRNLMGQFGIRAIVKQQNSTINVVWNGIGDNHWGLEVRPNSLEKPLVGELNHRGFKYDDVVELAPNIFYYQTN